MYVYKSDLWLRYVTVKQVVYIHIYTYSTTTTAMLFHIPYKTLLRILPQKIVEFSIKQIVDGVKKGYILIVLKCIC